MHFMYYCYNGKAIPLYEIIPKPRVLSPKLLKNLHFCKSNLFGTRHRDFDRSKSVSISNTENRILKIAEEKRGTSVRRI